MDDFAEVKISEKGLSLSFFIRIGWIPPKRLRSKFGVSAADTHIYTVSHTQFNESTHTHKRSILMIRHSFTKQPCWWFVHSWFLEFGIFCQVLPPGSICAH